MTTRQKKRIIAILMGGKRKKADGQCAIVLLNIALTNSPVTTHLQATYYIRDKETGKYCSAAYNGGLYTYEINGEEKTAPVYNVMTKNYSSYNEGDIVEESPVLTLNTESQYSDGIIALSLPFGEYELIEYSCSHGLVNKSTIEITADTNEGYQKITINHNPCYFAYELSDTFGTREWSDTLQAHINDQSDWIDRTSYIQNAYRDAYSQRKWVDIHTVGSIGGFHAITYYAYDYTRYVRRYGYYPTSTEFSGEAQYYRYNKIFDNTGLNVNVNYGSESNSYTYLFKGGREVQGDIETLRVDADNVTDAELWMVPINHSITERIMPSSNGYGIASGFLGQYNIRGLKQSKFDISLGDYLGVYHYQSGREKYDNQRFEYYDIDDDSIDDSYGELRYYSDSNDSYYMQQTSVSESRIFKTARQYETGINNLTSSFSTLFQNTDEARSHTENGITTMTDSQTTTRYTIIHPEYTDQYGNDYSDIWNHFNRNDFKLYWWCDQKLENYLTYTVQEGDIL